MGDSINWLFYFLIKLSFSGVILGIIFSPINFFILTIIEFVLFLVNAFLLMAIGVFLTLIFCNAIISRVIVELTRYRSFNSINPDRRIAKLSNFFRIYVYNFLFGLLLSLAVIFLIFSIFPFEEPKVIGEVSDFDHALFTALFVIPGFLLSLRLLSNPVKKVFPIPILILISLPNVDIIKVRERKERTLSFYFAFIETAVVSMVILFTYRVLKSGNSSLNIYSDILKSITPNSPYLTISIFIVAFLFSLFLTTAFGEMLLEWGDPIIQE